MDVRVHTKIREGEKERTQAYEGMVVALHGAGLGKTFTVRRVVSGVGVERVFPMFSPRVVNVEILGATKVRRAKLTYLRKSNVKRRSKEDQRVMKRALDAQTAQRRAAEKAQRDTEERERAKDAAAKKGGETPEASKAPQAAEPEKA
jgi:large subunit ribosomal protein L19